MKYLQFAGAIFKAEPINFSLLFLLTFFAGYLGNVFAVIVLLALIVAEGRIVVLNSKVRVLDMIIGMGVQELLAAQVEGAAHE